MELRRLEEREELRQDEQKLRGFNREINNTYDKNLDKCLVDFVDKNDLDECEILYYLRKFVQDVKKSLK